MSAVAQVAVGVPEWVIAEMPPGYQNRMAEIKRLSEELQDMDRFARLLWAIGPALRESVRDVFSTLKLEVTPIENMESALGVKVDLKRRLLVYVSGTEATIDKKSGELAAIFRLLQEVAGEHDRVVLVANGDRLNQPADRSDPIGSEALRLLQRMGVNGVIAPTLFKLWGVAMQDQERARKHLVRLHEQDGGIFGLPATA
jgi:hypothetical protein